MQGNVSLQKSQLSFDNLLGFLSNTGWRKSKSQIKVGRVLFLFSRVSILGFHPFGLPFIGAREDLPSSAQLEGFLPRFGRNVYIFCVFSLLTTELMDCVHGARLCGCPSLARLVYELEVCSPVCCHPSMAWSAQIHVLFLCYQKWHKSSHYCSVAAALDLMSLLGDGHNLCFMGILLFQLQIWIVSLHEEFIGFSSSYGSLER
ncbi:hypothetical protein MANES_13G006301v8 [Manihot esculenta]|nr:hypothetical protein MANES_13G006301v8 [Manihot esculenta]